MNPLLTIKRLFAPKEDKERIDRVKSFIEKQCANTQTELPPKAKEQPKELEELFTIEEDEDFFFGLVDRSLYTFNNIGKEHMPDGEKLIALIYCYRFETNGGGTTTYLSNSTGDEADQLDWALETIGSENLAAKFKEIKNEFPKGSIPSDRNRRCEHIELWEKKFGKLCNSMDHLYFELEDSETNNLMAMAVRWARKNKIEFVPVASGQRR
ncbi:MAG: DMP19 family protein [Puniceicoccales bacterium]